MNKEDTQTIYIHNTYFDLTTFLFLTCFISFIFFCFTEQRMLAFFSYLLLFLNIKLSAYIDYLEQIINYPFYAERIKNFKPIFNRFN